MQASGWALMLIILVGLAGVLAASALPERGASTRGAGLTLTDQQTVRTAALTTRDNAESSPAKDARPTPQRVARASSRADGSDKPATPVGTADKPMFGPPERVLTASERAVVPLLRPSGDSGEIDQVRDALRLATRGPAREALASARRLENAGGRALAQWALMRRLGSGVRAGEIERFRAANPEWPEQDLLRQRAEEALLLSGADRREVDAFFSDSAPQTGAGMAALGSARRAAGQPDEGVALIRKGFRKGGFGPTVEARFFSLFGDTLRPADIKFRLDQFLLDDDRYGRKRRLQAVRRLIGKLSGVEKAKAEARLAVWRTYGRSGRRRIAGARRAMGALDRRLAASRIPLPVQRAVVMAARKKPETVVAAREDKFDQTRRSAPAGSKNSPASAARTPDGDTPGADGSSDTTIAQGALEPSAGDVPTPPARASAFGAPRLAKPEAASPVTVSVPAPDAEKNAATARGSDAATDWPLAYHRAQLLRRTGDWDGARKILLAAPQDPTQLAAPDEWWIERRVHIYELLFRKRYRDALALAERYGGLGANARNEAAFLAGWISFRFLDDAPAGKRH
ncbi:MAG: hypothetical protein AAFQ35_15080, partial [Pseudomonadota bacterium]